MITTIRITNVQEAETALLMITAYLQSVKGESIEVKGHTFAEDKEVEAPPKAEKPVRKTKTAPKTATKPKSEPEPVLEPETAPEVTEKPVIALKDLTALAKKAVANTGREEVAAVIAEFGTGKLSSVPTEKYSQLEELLVKLA